MNVRNFLIPNDFVELVPIGIHLTLQYNASGNLEKIFHGFNADSNDITKEILSVMIEHKTVPCKIHITRGTSWVRGVLYTGEVLSESGQLPDIVDQKLLKKYIANPSQFNFFAGTIDSTATIIKGAVPIRQCLTMNKFNLLPGKLIPANFDQNALEAWTYGEQYPFIAPLVTDYIVFRKENIQFVSARLSQFIVSRIVKIVDFNGYIKAKVFKENDEDFIVVDYSDVIRFCIHPSTLVVLDGDNQIIYTHQSSKTEKMKVNSVLTCACCGKVFHVPDVGTVQCPDTHCSSRLLPRVLQFLTCMNLPVPDTSIMVKWISNQKIISIPDLFLLPEYRSKTVEITLSVLLRALVPISLIKNDGVFLQFASTCVNNIKTFQYYIHHVDEIERDLGMSHPDLEKLTIWLKDGYNLSDIDTLLETSQIRIKQIDKKFDGPPIFRGKTIMITGDFIRGTSMEISGILKSYSANVTMLFSDAIHCVLVGGTNENVDGKSVNAARSLNIPVIEEDDFFNQYEIDSDLHDLIN